MSRLLVAPIVEGHGEVEAVPLLLRRIWTELLGGEYVRVLPPIRIPRSKLIDFEQLAKAVELANLKLKDAASGDRPLILVLFDADEDAACTLGPTLLEQIRLARPDLDVAVVLPVAEFETWFVAAAESLSDYLTVSNEAIPLDPEAAGVKKAWLQRNFRGKYTETIEQPALTAKFDLRACRARSRSFDKLCRELEKRL